MAKIDYEHHQREYAKRLEENPKLKVAEYCDEVGLNYGTAKRYISKKAAKAKVSSKIDSASSARKSKGTRHDWHALLKSFWCVLRRIRLFQWLSMPTKKA